MIEEHTSKNHIMRLHKEPYEMIEKDLKHYEYRLNDEKRKLIKIGDTITFYKRPNETKSMTVSVIDLKYYPDLLSMYKATFDEEIKNQYNYKYKCPQDVVDDTKYYTKGEIDKYGCIAIKIKKIESVKNFV